jgi:hypothetical protein
MQLIALLVVLVLAGLMLARGSGGLSPKPGATATPTPSQTTREVEQATEASSQAELKHRDDVMKALR